VDWHLIHLYDPRAVVEWSTMPAFPFLFEERRTADVRAGEKVVPIAGPRARPGVTVVAKPEALALVDYLISLNRQYPVADSLRATDRMVMGTGAGGTHD
jgi:cytochrome c oxidase cbb3-type subunit 2